MKWSLMTFSLNKKGALITSITVDPFQPVFRAVATRVTVSQYTAKYSSAVHLTQSSDPASHP